MGRSTPRQRPKIRLCIPSDHSLRPPKKPFHEPHQHRSHGSISLPFLGSSRSPQFILLLLLGRSERLGLDTLFIHLVTYSSFLQNSIYTTPSLLTTILFPSRTESIFRSSLSSLPRFSNSLLHSHHPRSPAPLYMVPETLSTSRSLR